MNISDESAEWINPDGQNESMEDEEETEEELETSSEIGDQYSEDEDEEGENSRSEASPHMHITNGDGENNENSHDSNQDDEDEDESEDDDAGVGIKEDHLGNRVQQSPIQHNGIPHNGIQNGGHPKMTSSPRERHFVVTRQRDAVPMQAVKQNGGLVARQDDAGEMEEEEEEEEIEPGIIGPLHIDHVDFILDSIDAELSDLITKSSRASPEESKKKKNNGKKKTGSIKDPEGALQNGHRSADTTMDSTRLQENPVQLSQRYGVQPVGKRTKKTGKGRLKTRSQPSLTSPPKLRLNSYSMDDSVGTTSDADSISAEEVRRRVVQSLHRQEKTSSSNLPPHNQLTCSQEYHLATTPATNHTSNINSHSQSPPTTADNSPNAKVAEVNNNEIATQKKAGEKKKGRVKSDERSQDGRKKRSSISSNSSKQSNPKVRSSKMAALNQQEVSPVSDVSGMRGDVGSHILRLRDILNNSSDPGEEAERASIATEYLLSQPAVARRFSDMESVATEDFESAFQKFSMPESARSHRSKKPGKGTPNQEKQSKPVCESATQQLQRLKKNTEGKKMKRTVSAHPIEPSGLPEYMYMKKEVSEGDVGEDSMITEDYEAHFLAIPLKDIHTEHPNITPKKSPSRARKKAGSKARHAQPQSDPESVQTEDYEKRFRSMMVRRLAGVPISSFDSVTIQSDLDSVKSVDIKKKFRKAMHKHEVSGTSSIEEEEEVRSSKVAPKSLRTKGSHSGSLQSQSSESLSMKASIQQTKKGNPPTMPAPQSDIRPHHPTMHLTSPALHHSSMPNLSNPPSHIHPSIQPHTYAPPPPRDKWRSPPRVTHLESQPSPLRKRYEVQYFLLSKKK